MNLNAEAIHRHQNSGELGEDCNYSGKNNGEIKLLLNFSWYFIVETPMDKYRQNKGLQPTFPIE